MGLFAKLRSVGPATDAFESVIEGRTPPHGIIMPSWCDLNTAGDFLFLVKIALSHHNPMIALMTEKFSFTTNAAIMNAARVLESKGCREEEAVDMIANIICTYCRHHGGVAVLIKEGPL